MRLAAELAHADVEGDAGAGRLALEDHRQHLVLEQLRAVALAQAGLELGGQVEHAAQRRGGEILEIEEMPGLGCGHGRS